MLKCLLNRTVSRRGLSIANPHFSLARASSTTVSGRNDAIFNKYMSLPQGKGVQAEYIWIGGTGLDLRSKSRVIPHSVASVEDLPDWQFDGSSTGQAEGASSSEVHLRPVKYIADPFRSHPNILVLCECLTTKDEDPIPTNHRAFARSVFDNPTVSMEQPWFGLEQEYTFFEADGVTPLGWPRGGFPAPQGPYYCGVGARSAFGRQVVESHYRACNYSGLEVSGINAEVMPGQWEYQIGPVEGIDCADQMWLSRYILERVAEDFNVVVSYEPKPVMGDWNGAGCHANFSTESMRAEGGMDAIMSAIGHLEQYHQEHMEAYGKDNQKRMTGHHETASFDVFSHGVGHRGASVRIPWPVAKKGKGYLEDRRPAANMDPYLVTGMLAQTSLLSAK